VAACAAVAQELSNNTPSSAVLLFSLYPLPEHHQHSTTNCESGDTFVLDAERNSRSYKMVNFTDFKKHKCEQCDMMTFRRIEKHNIHLESMHTRGKKPFRCGKCGFEADT
jgi:hypothetical protein